MWVEWFIECVDMHDDRAKIVGWPPIRSYRKNSLQENEGAGIYVKVSMDGAPYLRKIDLKVYGGYTQLLKALENMFKLTIGEKNFIFVSFDWDEMKETTYIKFYDIVRMTWVVLWLFRWVLWKRRLQGIGLCTNLRRQGRWLDVSWRCSMGVSVTSLPFLLICLSHHYVELNLTEPYFLCSMFVTSCKRLRIMKGSEARGLGCGVWGTKPLRLLWAEKKCFGVKGNHALSLGSRIWRVLTFESLVGGIPNMEL